MQDAQARLSNAQAITATAASSNYYDFGATVDAGLGNPIPVNCSVGTAFTVLTHLAIAIETDDNTSFTTPTKLFETSVALAGLGANAQIKLPSIKGGCERYVQARYTVGGSNPTSGTINLSLGDQAQFNQPSGIPDGI
jgi:hypothetical protein